MRRLLYILIIGIVISAVFSSGQIENPDTHLRLTQTRIAIDDHSFGIPFGVGEDSHGNIAINNEGQRYMVYNPGQSIVFTPIYLFANKIKSTSAEVYYFSAFLVSFLNYLLHVFATYILYQICLKLDTSKKKSIIVALFFGLTSYSFSFAQSTYEHHYEMLAILICFYIALDSKIRHVGSCIGLTISIGMIFRSTTVLAIPGLFFLLNNKRESLRLLFTCIPGGLFILAYNYIRFDNVLESGYMLAWELAHGEYLDRFWSLKEIPMSAIKLFFSPGKGVVFFSTTVFISVFYFQSFLKQNFRLSISIIVTLILYILVFCSNFAWHGSVWSFGPRYILPVIPLLYLPLIKLKIKRWVYYLLFLGFFSQLLLVSVNYKRNVLESFVYKSDFSEQQYIADWFNVPQVSQATQLIKISSKNFSSELKNLQPNTFWVKEKRLGTNKDVLEYSIEKNSFNFWWIRILHWKLSFWTGCIVFLVLLICTVIGLIFINDVRKKLH